MNKYVITNGKIILPDGILNESNLVVENGIIKEIIDKKKIYPDYELIDAGGGYVSPGFIEFHIHGCSNFGFEDDDAEILDKAVSFLNKKGINTFVPTIQCSESVLRNLAGLIEKSSYSGRIPGIYIEGPFVNINQKGGILPKHIKKPDTGYLEKLLGISNKHVKLMTIAPELEGSPEIVELLFESGIIPCLGHSSAELSDVSFINNRKVNITHLFNTMSPVSHKTAGLAMLPFINRNVYFELNSDLNHINEDVVRMCYNHLNHDRLILITDAVASAGADYGSYSYFGKEVISDKTGVRYKEEGTMVGSNSLITEVVKRFIQVTEAPIYEVVKFATYNPCKLLGIDDRKGSIAPGKEADLVIFDDDFNVLRNLA